MHNSNSNSSSNSNKVLKIFFRDVILPSFCIYPLLYLVRTSSIHLSDQITYILFPSTALAPPSPSHNADYGPFLLSWFLQLLQDMYLSLKM